MGWARFGRSSEQRKRRIHSRPSGDRLDSWKKIASYLKRDVSTVQRWERREAMPVHRHLHDKLGSVLHFARSSTPGGRLGARDSTQEGADERPAQILQTAEDASRTTARASIPTRPCGWALQPESC